MTSNGRLAPDRAMPVGRTSSLSGDVLGVLVKKSHLSERWPDRFTSSRRLGRMGRILGRLGTDVGTDKMCKITNVYRPWGGGTDKLGGRRHISSKNPPSLRSFGATSWRDKSARQAILQRNPKLQAPPKHFLAPKLGERQIQTRAH